MAHRIHPLHPRPPVAPRAPAPPLEAIGKLASPGPHKLLPRLPARFKGRLLGPWRSPRPRGDLPRRFPRIFARGLGMALLVRPSTGSVGRKARNGSAPLALGLIGWLLGVSLPATAAQGSLGVVTAVRGLADVAHPRHVAALAGRPPQEPLMSGDSVFPGDVIDINRDSLAQLRVAGRATLIVSELSRIELREVRNPKRLTGPRTLVRLLVGGLRTVVQRGARAEDAFEIETPHLATRIWWGDFLAQT